MAAEPARIEACARSPFKNVRLYALDRLQAEGHPRRHEILVPLLRDPDPEVQLEAVRLSGVLECKEALPILLELLRSADEPVAVQAAVSLGELGHYGDVAPDLEDPPVPGRPSAAADAMSSATFYTLFAILSVGLFLSGYLFRAEMEAPVEESPSATSSAGAAGGS